MDGSIHFQFQSQASLFSEESIHKRNALILGGDQQTLYYIISTAIFEGENQTILRKPDFLFGDAVLDTDQQLLAREGQWFYILKGDHYYLLSSKRHYPLAFFQLVTTSRKMSWSVSKCMKSMHVGILIINGFS